MAAAVYWFSYTHLTASLAAAWVAAISQPVETGGCHSLITYIEAAYTHMSAETFTDVAYQCQH